MRPEDQNARDSSQATLNSFSQARNMAVLSVRPPLWLVAIASMLFAIITLLMYFDSDNDVKRIAAAGAIFLYWLTWCLYCYLLRKRGIKVRTIPRSVPGKLFVLGQGIFYIVVIIAGAAVLDQGVQWAPYVAALVNGLSWGMLTHRYPTGELTPGEALA